MRQVRTLVMVLGLLASSRSVASAQQAQPAQPPPPLPEQQPPPEPTPAPAEPAAPASPAPAPAAAATAEEPDATKLEIYGFAMLDGGYDFGHVGDPAWFDTLRPTKLPAFDDQFGKQDSSVVVDARLTYQLTRTRLFVDLKNLFDEEYSEFGVIGSFPRQRAFYPSPGFHVLGGVDVSWGR